eukprot:9090962-Alexandrium_andersonii.AAC.1
MDSEAIALDEREAILGLRGAPRSGALNSGLGRLGGPTGWWRGIPPLMSLPVFDALLDDSAS